MHTEHLTTSSNKILELHKSGVRTDEVFTEEEVIIADAINASLQKEIKFNVDFVF